jgi:delta-aminolevulinic acid dehydratase/porphobilinogen synthase
MTKMKLTALDLYIITDTLLHSLSQGQYYTGSATKEARDGVLKKLQIIMNDMSVEIITDKAEFTIDADAGI